jgi:hypothetical protein
MVHHHQPFPSQLTPKPDAAVAWLRQLLCHILGITVRLRDCKPSPLGLTLHVLQKNNKSWDVTQVIDY